MFNITDEIRNKKGYIKLENIAVYIPDNNGESEIKKADIELFGGALRVVLLDGSNKILMRFNSDTINCEIKGKVNDSLYLIEFNKLLLIGNIQLYDALNDYSKIVNDNIGYFESFYSSQEETSTTSPTLNELSGIEFENLCKNLLEKMNFEVSTTKQSGDGGIDLIAYSHQPMLEGKYIVQCKRYSGSVGEPIIRDLYGVVNSERANKGILITTGTFTKSAVEFSMGKQLELIDGEKLNQLLNSYSVSFDSGTKSSNNSNSLYTLLLRFEKELGVRHFSAEKIMKQIDYLKTEPTNNKMRASVLVQLLLPFEDLGDIKDQYLKLICDEYHYQLNMYEKYLNNSNLMEQRLLYLFKAQSIQLRIMSGEFFEATNEYFEIASKKLPTKDLSIDAINEFTLVLYSVSYNIIQIALIIDEHSLARNVQIRATNWMKTAYDYYKDFNYEWAKKECYRAQHPLEMDSFIILSPSSVKEFYEAVYELGINSFMLSLHAFKIIIENDILTIQDVKTINNISEKIAKAKRLI